MVLQSIEADDAWKWADSPCFKNALQDAKRSVQNFVSSDDFLGKLLTQDINELRRATDANVFATGLRQFLANLDLDDVDYQAKLLLNQQQARKATK